jgi:DNA-binding MarR family transcriptional regulator
MQVLGKIEVQLLADAYRTKSTKALWEWLCAVQTARWRGGRVENPSDLLKRRKMVRLEHGIWYVVGRRVLTLRGGIRSRQCAILEAEYLKDLKSFRAFCVSAYLAYKQGVRKAAIRKAKKKGFDGPVGTNLGQIELAKQLGVDQSTISRHLKVAEQEKMILKEIVPNPEFKLRRKDLKLFLQVHPEHRGKIIQIDGYYYVRYKDTLYPYISLSLRRFRA